LAHFSKLLPKPPNKQLKMMFIFCVSSLAAGHKTLVPGTEELKKYAGRHHGSCRRSDSSQDYQYLFDAGAVAVLDLEQKLVMLQ
jgi:hypothetical protein